MYSEFWVLQVRQTLENINLGKQMHQKQNLSRHSFYFEGKPCNKLHHYSVQRQTELFLLNPDQDQNMTHPTFNKSLVNSALTKILWSQFAQLSVQQDIRTRDNVGRIRSRSLPKLSFLTCSTRQEKVHIRCTFITENIQFGLAKGASCHITCAILTIASIQ